MTSHLIFNRRVILACLILTFSTNAQSINLCKVISIQELAYMDKKELIKVACKASSDWAKYSAEHDHYITKAAEANQFKLDAMKLGNQSLMATAQDQYNSYYKNAIEYLEDASCSTSNNKNAKNVLRKDHGVDIEDFEKKYCLDTSNSSGE